MPKPRCAAATFAASGEIICGFLTLVGMGALLRCRSYFSASSRASCTAASARAFSASASLVATSR
ncbi:Uncharacterised protein [Mycobacteroides abscessus subsp. abscessus]|nr:Uncharacterised protein [Mycobacteroides abscessus subsp. abscessus]